MASVSTFQDHRATPAAWVAARKCFSLQIAVGETSDSALLLLKAKQYLTFKTGKYKIAALKHPLLYEVRLSTGNVREV
jgi:hypothetical protein